ncbi:lipopolysaccharide kinase InaA family protein [Aestuariirhabdus sp. LZHN29]|uniref:lipopolysaccharide kinase InaA family protein n=1 Tax=Aestuariirhabdus sp. LZHN29 TaxID=3417462 RepID=UPI003CF0659F
MPTTSHHTLASLQHAGHELNAPFDIQLDGEPVWHCSQVLRMLPGRRVVLRLETKPGTAQARAQTLVVKLFYRDKDYLREREGYQHLIDQGIDTPEMLHHYQHPNGEQALVQYAFSSGQSLLQRWREAEGAEQPLAVLRSAVGTTAALHHAGLVQADIHLDNFLATGDRVQVIDSASISAHATPLERSTALENLALLLAQLPPRADNWTSLLWQHYVDAIGNPGFDSNALGHAVTRMRAQRWRHYRKKLFRECTEFQCQQSFKRLLIQRRDANNAALQQLLADPDPFVDGGEILKRGNTATVSRVTINGQRWVVKRFNLKGLGHALSRGLRPSRAWHYWSNAYRLRFDGIATPLALAFMEERAGPLRGRAFLVMESIEGTDLATALNIPSASPCPVATLKRQVVEMFDGLYRSRLSHGDTKASNLLVTAEGLQLIDLDSLRSHRHDAALKSALRKDLDRFLRNWEGPLRTEFEALLAPFAKKLETL